MFWFLLFALPGVAARVCGYPLFPFVWLGMLVAGLSAQYPVSPSGRKSDPPEQRDLDSYHRWKDMLAGLKPGGDWIAVRRVSWWMGWMSGLLVAASERFVWCPLLELPFAFMCMMGLTRALDRREDRRHIYRGVSVPAFMRNGVTARRVAAVAVPLGVLVVLLAVGMVMSAQSYTADAGKTLSWMTVVALPGILFLLLVWLFDRKRQSVYWRELVEWQSRLDQWFDGDDLKKAWDGAYLTQCSRLGDADNPMTVLRIRMQGSDGKPRGNQPVFKLGVEPVKAPAASDGFHFVVLLAAKQKKRGESQFDPSSVRLVIGRDESCLPDASRRELGEKMATLVADIAYARTAVDWKRRAPLTEVHDVSDDPERAAWLIRLFLPPEGGDTMGKISVDWLAGDDSPERTLRLPLFSDLDEAFHLAATEDTPLSDEGNKWRPQGIITASKSFDNYIRLSRRFKADQTTWQSITGAKTTPPTLQYDGETTYDCDGWAITLMPIQYPAPHTIADYAKHDLSPLQPEAKFVGLTAGANNTGNLVTVTGMGAPTRIDRLTGNTNQHRQYAHAIVYKGLLDVLKGKADITIEACTQEGRDIAIWRVRFRLAGGANIADIRKQSAHFAATVGAAHVLWDWRSADSATIWMSESMPLGVEDLPHWARPGSQKRFIELALSESWGVAGVSDTSGRTPQVLSLGALKRNERVLCARFRIPAGLSIDKPGNNIGKFLTASGYQYGRILPRGDEHGADMYDMVLSKSSPFPTMVDADWEYAKSRDPWTFPLGVDDMGNPVEWNTKATPHILICGKSGTGKSSAAQVVVAEALLKGYDIILVDPSKGCIDFTQWAKRKAIAFVGEGQLRETTAVIGWLRDEMSHRVHLNNKYGVGNINDIPEDAISDEDRPHLKRILLVFDEFNSYLTEMGKTQSNPNNDVHVANDNAAIIAINASIINAMSDLAKIAVQGRTAGIDLLLGAQRLTMDDMKRFNANAFFRTLGRVLLGSDSPSGVFSQMNIKEANRLQASLKGAGGTVPRGRGMYESADSTLSAVQTWWSGGQDELSDLVAGIPDATPIDYTPFMPVEAEQFGEMSDEEVQKALAAQAGEDLGEEMSPDEIDAIEDTGDDEDDIEDVDW